MKNYGINFGYGKELSVTINGITNLDELYDLLSFTWGFGEDGNCTFTREHGTFSATEIDMILKKSYIFLTNIFVDKDCKISHNIVIYGKSAAGNYLAYDTYKGFTIEIKATQLAGQYLVVIKGKGKTTFNF